MNLIKKLNELKLSLNLKTKDIADLLNIKYDTYWNWESGRSQPPLEYLIKLSKLFNVSTDYLLGLTDIKNPASKEDCEKLKNLTKEQKEALEILLELNSKQLNRAFGYIQGILINFDNNHF